MRRQRPQLLDVTAPAEVRRIARLFPSFRDFVDDALFHPRWGYYSTGRVRFGEGGHYDTFPLALSPLFGRMLAQYAYRLWCRLGRPPVFEICELGAGNGQLCVDVIVWGAERARHDPAWRGFAQALRYRIIERSAALRARQREQLGRLARSVTWTAADLTQRAARGAPFAPCGLVFANEVLDCLAHHKVVSRPDGTVGVVYVIPVLHGAASGAATDVCLSPPGVARRVRWRAVPRAALARVLRDEHLRRHLHFREVLLPIQVNPSLHAFLFRQCPELFVPGYRWPAYFACPAIETLIRNTGRLYRLSEAVWIDYGDVREFHLRAPERLRVFAGPPRSGASVYRAPGWDDITFLVDFSVVAGAALQAGLRVKFYGGQGELARRSGVVLDRGARDLIVRSRALGWMLAVLGIGAESPWRRSALTWNKKAGKGGRIRDDVQSAAAEFLGKRRSPFKLLILRSTP